MFNKENNKKISFFYSPCGYVKTQICTYRKPRRNRFLCKLICIQISMQIMPECLSTFIEININENDMCDLHAFDQVKKISQTS